MMFCNSFRAGLTRVEAGIMRGLSVGLNFLDNPPVTWEMGEGTREKPDKLIYEAVRVMEVSDDSRAEDLYGGIDDAPKTGQ